MLPTANSLKLKSDFEAIKKAGKVINFSSFGIGLLKRGDKKPSRFGFVVSTTVSPHATIRNRVKRAMREAVRHSLSIAKPGFDCVFLAKPSIVKVYTQDIMHEVKKALVAAKVTS